MHASSHIYNKLLPLRQTGPEIPSTIDKLAKACWFRPRQELPKTLSCLRWTPLFLVFVKFRKNYRKDYSFPIFKLRMEKLMTATNYRVLIFQIENERASRLSQ